MRDNFLDYNNPTYLRDNFFSDDSWRHVDRTFKCHVCGKVWSQQVIQPTTITCPFCEEAEHEQR